MTHQIIVFRIQQKVRQDAPYIRTARHDARYERATAIATNQTMTRWGVGPLFALGTIVCGAVAVALRVWWPAVFGMDFVPYWMLVAIGAALCLIGVPFWIVGVRTAMRAYEVKTLCIGGVFGLCRHPIYGSWVVFIVPGVALLMNSWIALTVPVVMYVLLRLMVRQEEAYLEGEFGEAYRAYKRRVPAVLPLGWLTR